MESLNNRAQRDIVADDRQNTNALVLAGPGSGKTRVLVHRIAYLVRGRREDPRSILALAYNRHAAVQIRQRLHDLIGDDASGVTVLTCHALAMRLAGSTFARSIEQTEGQAQSIFDDILKEAIELLEGGRVAPDEADEQRERLLAGFRWILVDEYQDIKELEYSLISALAGWTKGDQDHSRVPGSGVRGRGSGERETTASSLAGKEESSRKEDNGGQGKDGPAGAIAQGGNGR